MCFQRKKNNRSPTFRSRLALRLVLLILLALSATFFVALWTIHFFVQAEIRKRLQDVTIEARSAYLGEKISEPQVQLPEPLYRRIQTRFPGIRLGLVEKEKGNSGWVYEMLASCGGEHLEILARVGGDIWVAKRTPLQEVMERVESTLREEIPAAKIFLLEPDGTPAPSSEITVSAHDSYRFDIPSIPAGGIWLRHNENRWTAGTRLFDNRLLVLVYRDQMTARLIGYGTLFYLLLLSFFLPLSAWIGWHIARKAMVGVERVTQAATQVESGCFTTRVDRGNEGREIEELAEAFNAMVERIELLMRELRDLSVHIAHDLRTPVARIRGLLESTDWSEISSRQREHLVGDAIEECDRLVALINDVLEIAQAEGGVLGLQCESFNFSEEVERLVSIFSGVAEEKEISVQTDLPREAVLFFGDRGRIQRILANLLDNAVKYTPVGGKVKIRLAADASSIRLEIEDSGPGIPKEERQRVFERFYRGEKGRSTPGNGLGLNLVKAFVSAHKGTVELCDSATGGCVRIIFPRSQGGSV